MNTAGTISNSDAAFYRDRKAMLVYPLIIIPFTTALFFVLGGGKGNRYVAEDALAGKPGSGGFNATMPSAENSKINGRNIDAPGYGKAKAGQVLSSFTHTRADSSTSGLKAISVKIRRHRLAMLQAWPPIPLPLVHRYRRLLRQKVRMSNLR